MTNADFLAAVREACEERMIYWRAHKHPRAFAVPSPMDEVGLAKIPEDGRTVVAVPAAEDGLCHVATVPPDLPGKLALVEIMAKLFLEPGVAMLGMDDGSAPQKSN